MDDRSYTLPTAPQSIGHVLDNAVLLYRKSFFSVLPLLFLFSLFSYSTYFIAFPPFDLGGVSVFVYENHMAYLVIQTTIVSTLFIAILYRLHAFTYNIPCSSLDAISIALWKLIPFLIYLTIQSAIVGLMFLPNLFPEYQLNPIAWLSSIVGSILFIYTLPAAVLLSTHKINLLTSLKRSLAIMNGHFWRMTNFYFILIVLYLAIGLGISILLFGLVSYGVLLSARTDLLQISAQAMVMLFFGGLIYSGLITSIHDLELRQQQNQKINL